MPARSKPTVFINCPFDSAFNPLFKSLIFTILYLEFEPVFSITKSSDSIRIQTIMKLIEKARFGIHDLSRNQAATAGELARFNMPFELGLDIGSKRYGGPKFSHKKILILDAQDHVYDKYIGDISGQDIVVHNNSPKLIIKRVRDWFASLYPKRKLPGESKIWSAFNQFNADLPMQLKDNFTPREVRNLQMSDYKQYAIDWIDRFK